jgi:hypothetical protein
MNQLILRKILLRCYFDMRKEHAFIGIPYPRTYATSI